jgi:hypothetical protein
MTNGIEDVTKQWPHSYRHWILGKYEPNYDVDSYYENPDFEIDAYTGDIRMEEDRISIKKILKNKENSDVDDFENGPGIFGLSKKNWTINFIKIINHLLMESE